MLPEEPNPKLERVSFQLRATGLKPESPNPQRSGIHSRGYLPHVKREGASYFVTFRLADSLPKEVLLKIQSRRAERLRRFYAQQEAFARGQRVQAPEESEEEINREYHREVERYLDRGLGSCSLRKPEIAALVANAMRYFDGQRYVLRGWVVMPNHAHAVIWPMPNYLIGKIVATWKGYSAREANKLLGTGGGRFWQPEPFDHWIRTEEEKARCTRYVIRNPVAAGLCRNPEDWQWSSAWPGWKTKQP